MELTHLKYFVAVAHELHFRKAAGRLNISQAPLSQQIARLEDELGVKLFERTSRVVKLTDAGRIFLAEAETVLKRAAHAVGQMEQFASGDSGRLAIGYNEPALNTFLPKALFRFKKEYPGLELQLHEMETEAQLNALRSGEIDVGILRPFGYDLSEFESRFIFSENYVLAMNPAHPLAKKKSLAVKMLDGQELLLFARSVNPFLFDRIMDILHANGVWPEVRPYARNKASMLALARAGFGAALIPESCAKNAGNGMVFQPLPAIFPSVEIYAVREKSSPHPAAENFLRSIYGRNAGNAENTVPHNPFMQIQSQKAESAHSSAKNV
ncbi:MAG: HTH-type transcriptional regulator BenM [Lentisphaerae bacterium ADurb.Bin242]|nr:MAG: HTH-type transcriptional regulator BenM [Lentisphaerae bacterium ADurb.Bin242]